jgi:hypothetical protein
LRTVIENRTGIDKTYKVEDIGYIYRGGMKEMGSCFYNFGMRQPVRFSEGVVEQEDKWVNSLLARLMS